MAKSIAGVFPATAETFNAHTDTLWGGSNGRLSGFQVVSFSHLSGALVIGPGSFIIGGVVVTQESNVSLSVSLNLINSGVTTYVWAVNPGGNNSTIAPQFDFGANVPPDAAVLLTSSGVGASFSWTQSASLSPGVQASEVAAMRVITGSIPLHKTTILHRSGSSFDGMTIRNVHSALIHGLSSLTPEDSQRIWLGDIQAETDDATHMEQGAARGDTWYYLYVFRSVAGRRLRFSYVPPVLGLHPSYKLCASSAFTPGGNVTIGTNNRLVVRSARTGLTHTLIVRPDTYSFRGLLAQIMAPDNWSEGYSPIRATDIGGTGGGSSRQVLLYSSEPPLGSDASAKLEFLSDTSSMHALLGLPASTETIIPKDSAVFVCPVFHHESLGLLGQQASQGGVFLYESSASGSASSRHLAKTITGSASSQEVDFSSMAPANAKMVFLEATASVLADFSLVGRGAQADISHSEIKRWSGAMSLGGTMIARLSVTQGETDVFRLFVRGYAI